jgi:hypothetical protein
MASYSMTMPKSPYLPPLKSIASSHAPNLPWSASLLRSRESYEGQDAMPNAYKYIIPGEPMSLNQAHYGNEQRWSPSKERQLIWKIHLQQQQLIPPFTIPIHLICNFFFRKHPVDQFKYLSIHTPDLISLIKFCEFIGRGILWTSTRIIIKESAEKTFAPRARTEITIITLND